MAEIKIKSVEIKIGQKTIKISLEQARELKGALNDLFPDLVYYPIIPTCPVYPSCLPWTYTTDVDGSIDGTVGLNITIY